MNFTSYNLHNFIREYNRKCLSRHTAKSCCISGFKSILNSAKMCAEQNTAKGDIRGLLYHIYAVNANCNGVKSQAKEGEPSSLLSVFCHRINRLIKADFAPLPIEIKLLLSKLNKATLADNTIPDDKEV